MPFRHCLLLPAALFAFASGAAATTARVDPDSVLVESFRGWGTSLCWWANVVGGLENHEEFSDAIFGDLGLTIVRYNIGGGENPAYPDLPADPRARVPGFQPERGEWDFEADANQRRILRAAITRGVKHVDAFSNSPPWWMTVSGSVTGGLNPIANNLKADDEETFANYLVDVMAFLAKEDDVRFDTIAPMNEPLSPWWYGNRQEGCHMKAAQQARVLDHLHAAIEKSGMSIGLVAPETFSATEAVRALKEFPPETRERLRAVAVHGYDIDDAANLRESAGATPVWMSESGDGDQSGIEMARAILDHLNILRVEEWVMWQAVSRPDGWGVIVNPLDGKSTQCDRTPKFDVLRQFTNFIPPGSRIVATHDADSIAAIPPDVDSLVIVALNSGDDERAFSADLSATSPADGEIRVVQTTPEDSLSEMPPPTAKDDVLDVTLPPRSVTTIVVPINPSLRADAPAPRDPA